MNRLRSATVSRSARDQSQRVAPFRLLRLVPFTPRTAALRAPASSSFQCVISESSELSMNQRMFSFERFSLTSAFAELRRDKPALSRWQRHLPTERENCPQVVGNLSTMAVVHGPNAFEKSKGSLLRRKTGKRRIESGRRGRAVLPGSILCFVLIWSLFSPLKCGAQFSVLWKFPLPGRWSDAAPAIATNGTLYQPTFDGTLLSITPNGGANWRFKAGLEIESSPAIGNDGTIYFGSRDRKFYALTQAGTLKWTFDTGAWNDASPAIGDDGTIYFGSWNRLFYALNPDGSVKWKFQTGAVIDSSPAIGNDGTIYFGSHDKRFYALAPDGKLKWSFTTGAPIISSPAIGNNGVIYFTLTDGNLYALKPDGTELWHLRTGGASPSSPVLDSHGTLYLGVNQFAFAVGADGKKLWQLDLGLWVEGAPAATDSVIYFTSRTHAITATSTDGVPMWAWLFNGDITASPTISKDGVVYIAGDSYLAAIAPTNAAPPAASPWPMFRANARHTGRVGVPGLVD